MRNKIIIAVASLMALSAVSAYAAGTYGTSLPTGLAGKLSTNVSLAYAAETNSTGYVAGTYHSKGTKSFASSSGDSAIFVSTTTATDLPDAPVGTASAAFASGTWTAL